MVQTFKEYLLIRELTPKTIDKYLNYFKLYQDKYPTGFNQEIIDKFLTERENSNDRSLNKTRKAFIIAYLGYLKKNFPQPELNDIQITKQTGRKKPKETKHISYEQVKELCNKLYRKDLKFCLIAILLFEGGFRISELLALRWKDINLKDKKIKIKESKTGFREVIFSDNTLALIYEYMDSDHYNPEQVFTFNTVKREMLDVNRKESHRIRVAQILRQYGQEHLGIDLHPHMFRHGCGFYLTNVLEMPLDEVAIYLGHSKIDTTRIYAHKDKEKVLDKIKKSYDE